MQESVMPGFALPTGERRSTAVHLMALMQAVCTILVLLDQRPPLVDIRVQEHLVTCERMVGALTKGTVLGVVG